MGREEALEPLRRAQSQGFRGQSERFPYGVSVLTSNHQPESLLPCQGGWRLGAEARASEVRSQGEDWGWLGEHSLKRASAPQLARRELGVKVWTC